MPKLKRQDKITTLLRLSKKREEEGKYFEAIEMIEEALSILVTTKGANHKKTKNTVNRLCNLCNIVGMIFLQQKKFKLSLEMLKKAETFSNKSLIKKSLTYNNLACLYKSQGKMRVALNYLQEALVIEKKLKNNQNIADLFLNICAVLSSLKKHKEAFQASLNSVALLQEELLNYCLPFVIRHQDQKENVSDESKNRNSIIKTKFDHSMYDTIQGTTEKENLADFKTKQNDFYTIQLNGNPQDKVLEKSTYIGKTVSNKQLRERVTILTIAYHNMAVELEHMKLYEDSMEVYQKACNLSNQMLNDENELVNNLKQVAETATVHLTQKLKEKPKEKKFVLKTRKLKSAVQNVKHVIKNKARIKTAIVKPKRAVSQYKQVERDSNDIFKRKLTTNNVIKSVIKKQSDIPEILIKHDTNQSLSIGNRDTIKKKSKGSFRSRDSERKLVEDVPDSLNSIVNFGNPVIQKGQSEENTLHVEPKKKKRNSLFSHFKYMNSIPAKELNNAYGLLFSFFPKNATANKTNCQFNQFNSTNTT